jgi:hypothetical protein
MAFVCSLSAICDPISPVPIIIIHTQTEVCLK